MLADRSRGLGHRLEPRPTRPLQPVRKCAFCPPRLPVVERLGQSLLEQVGAVELLVGALHLRQSLMLGTG